MCACMRMCVRARRRTLSRIRPAGCDFRAARRRRAVDRWAFFGLTCGLSVARKTLLSFARGEQQRGLCLQCTAASSLPLSLSPSPSRLTVMAGRGAVLRKKASKLAVPGAAAVSTGGSSRSVSPVGSRGGSGRASPLGSRSVSPQPGRASPLSTGSAASGRKCTLSFTERRDIIYRTRCTCTCTRVCACVCARVGERERERVSECVCVCVCVCVHVSVCAAR
jgi:hypothetical protein